MRSRPYKWRAGWSDGILEQVVDVVPGETYTLEALAKGGTSAKQGKNTGRKGRDSDLRGRRHRGDGEPTGHKRRYGGELYFPQHLATRRAADGHRHKHALQRQQGERATVAFQTARGTKQLHPSTAMLGSVWVSYDWAKGKQAKAEILVIPKVETLLKRRAEFIVAHQQMRVGNDNRLGAYMVYDNEGDSIYLNDTKNCNPVDRDEGRERVGMGVFLTRMQQRYPQLGLQGSLTGYARFVRRLQTKDYTTYSNTRHEGWNRNYNYSWVATFYFEMYRVSGERGYLLDAYHTLRALFRQFGHGFYAIDIPDVRSGAAAHAYCSPTSASSLPMAAAPVPTSIPGLWTDSAASSTTPTSTIRIGHCVN